MKKIFTMFAALLFAAGTFAASYGIMINSTDYHAGELNPSPGDPSYTEYMVLGVQVAKDATLQLWDQENNAGWAVDLDGASTAKIVKDGDHYVCNEAGCFDFYIKLKYNADQLYIGETECGGQGGQGGQGGTTDGNPRYYYKGFIDDADFEPDASSLFHDGVATISFSKNAMLFVIYQVDGQEGVQYMTSEWIDGQDHATLSVNGNGGYNKWNCPMGTTTLYLYDNGDGTLEISSKPMAGKTLVGGGQGIEEVSQKSEAESRKFIKDGKLYIRVGEKEYDATGRQL